MSEDPSVQTTARTSVAPDGVHQLDLRAKLPHLLHHLTDLQSQLVRGSDAEALKAQTSMANTHLG